MSEDYDYFYDNDDFDWSRPQWPLPLRCAALSGYMMIVMIIMTMIVMMMIMHFTRCNDHNMVMI